MSIANAQASLTPNLDPTVPAPMTNVAEYGFEGRVRRLGRRRLLFRVLEGRQSNRLGIRAAGSDQAVRSRDLPGRADRRGTAGFVRGPGH
jgi:hypothetical protein